MGEKVEEKTAVGMSYCELGIGWVGGWVEIHSRRGWVGGWVGGWMDERTRWPFIAA